MFGAIVCADWSKDPRRRAAYVADVEQRRIRRLLAPPFDLTALLARVGEVARDGRTIVAIDAPLGAPRSMIAATRPIHRLSPETGFREWLAAIAAHPDFFTPGVGDGPWSATRPFVRVRAGRGSLAMLFAAIRARGVEPFRDVDRATQAKSPFVVSGLPGSVGSSVIDLWPVIAATIGDGRGSIGLWPSADLGLDSDGPPLLAEIYPRAVYALALSPEPPDKRARLKIDKGRACCRAAAASKGLASAWVRDHGVKIEDVDPETIDEDAFDAMMSASALLRCAIEGSSLGYSNADRFEGGILGLDSLNLCLPERRFDCGAKVAKYRADD